MSSIVKSGGGAAKQEKTITAGTYVKEVLPDTGKLLSKVVVNPTPTEEKTVTPTTSQQTVSPSEGKHLAKVIVNAMEDVTPEVTAQTPIIKEIIEGLVGKAQGATASAETILKGYSAYVNGKLVNGTAIDGTDLLLRMTGLNKLAIDKFTLSSDSYGDSTDLYHSLGEVPTGVILWSDASISEFTHGKIKMYFGPSSSSRYYRVSYKNTTPYEFKATGANGDNFHSSDESKIRVNVPSPYQAGIEYTLITMA